MRLRKNDDGMTLIELIICIAISGIILSMIIIIISSASHGFRRTNDEVNLQLEAQTVINQMTNLAMEASKIDDVEITAPDKKFLIYGEPISYALLYIAGDKKLYLIGGDTTELANSTAYTATPEFEEKYLMAEYVSNITIIGLNTNQVTIDISFAMGDDTYTVNKKVKLRNAN